LVFQRKCALLSTCCYFGSKRSGSSFVQLCCSQISLLSAQFTVYAVDQRGHGDSADGPIWRSIRSGRSPEMIPSHTPAQLQAPRITKEQLQARMKSFPIPATDVIDVLKQLGLQQPLCFGHSLGGTMALVAEIFCPGLWKKVCVFEPPVTATVEQVCNWLCVIWLVICGAHDVSCSCVDSHQVPSTCDNHVLINYSFQAVMSASFCKVFISLPVTCHKEQRLRLFHFLHKQVDDINASRCLGPFQI
jgi:hypothetical protein